MKGGVPEVRQGQGGSSDPEVSSSGGWLGYPVYSVSCLAPAQGLWPRSKAGSLTPEAEAQQYIGVNLL